VPASSAKAVGSQHAFWTTDGSAPGPAKLGRGNRWIIAGIVVALPFVTHPVCLPILFRLLGRQGFGFFGRTGRPLLGLLADTFPGRRIHAVGMRPTTASRCWSAGSPSPPGYRPMPPASPSFASVPESTPQ
jgi:hypothetical protein